MFTGSVRVCTAYDYWCSCGGPSVCAFQGVAVLSRWGNVKAEITNFIGSSNEFFFFFFSIYYMPRPVTGTEDIVQ